MDETLSTTPGKSTEELSKYNGVLMALGRGLIPVDYVNLPRFVHDPAVPVSPLGRLEPALTLTDAVGDLHVMNVTLTSLIRGRNQIVSIYRGLIGRLREMKQMSDNPEEAS